METVIEAAIKALAEKINGDVKAPEAINFTQAALNLAHTLQVLKQVKQ
jgi:hypothetical protein